MIILDHVLFGYAITKALGIDDKRAMYSVIALSIIPDLDTLLGIPGTVKYLNNHRIYTHNIFFGVIIAILFTVLLAKKSKYTKVQYFLICLSGFAGHVLLDCFNSFGIRVLYPISRFRVAFSLIFELDLIFTSLLTIAIVIMLIFKNMKLPFRLALFSICLIYVFCFVPFIRYYVEINTDHHYLNITTDNKCYKRNSYPSTFWNWRVVYDEGDRYCLIKTRGNTVAYYEKSCPSYKEIQNLDVVHAYMNYSDTIAFEEKDNRIEIFSVRYSKETYKVVIEKRLGRWEMVNMTSADIWDKE